jgi:hypothetical protein
MIRGAAWDGRKHAPSLVYLSFSFNPITERGNTIVGTCPLNRSELNWKQNE